MSLNTLRVLSYNIEGLPRLPARILRFFSGAHDESRFARIGDILRQRRESGDGPHIVAIQEAFHSKHRELIERSGYPYYSYGPGDGFFKTNSGLVILSEFPILETHRTVFLHGMGWDFLARKGAQHVLIDVPGWEKPLSVMNTHLNADANALWYPSFIARWVRVRQAAHLRRFLARIWEPTSPLILVGDFNFVPNQHDYISFLNFPEGPAIHNAAIELHALAQQRIDEIHSMIDHQFFHRALQPVRFERTFRHPPEVPFAHRLSDHEGVEVHYTRVV